MQSLAPGQSTRNRRHVVENGRVHEVGILNAVLSVKENSLNLLQILLVEIEQHDVLLLELVLNYRSVE